MLNRIKYINDIPQLKTAIYSIVNGGSDEDLFPRPIGTVKVRTPKKGGIFESKSIMITESQLEKLIETLK